MQIKFGKYHHDTVHKKRGPVFAQVSLSKLLAEMIKILEHNFNPLSDINSYHTSTFILQFKFKVTSESLQTNIPNHMNIVFHSWPLLVHYCWTCILMNVRRQSQTLGIEMIKRWTFTSNVDEPWVSFGDMLSVPTHECIHFQPLTSAQNDLLN